MSAWIGELAIHGGNGSGYPSHILHRYSSWHLGLTGKNNAAPVGKPRFARTYPPKSTKWTATISSL